MRNRLSRFAVGGLVVAGIALALLERERFAPDKIEAWVAGLLAALSLLPSLIRRGRPPATIPPGELRELLLRLDPPLILDVRNADEYAGELGHIEGSLLIPVGDLEARLGELISDRRRLIVPV